MEKGTFNLFTLNVCFKAFNGNLEWKPSKLMSELVKSDLKEKRKNLKEKKSYGRSTLLFELVLEFDNLQDKTRVQTLNGHSMYIC